MLNGVCEMIPKSNLLEMDSGGIQKHYIENRILVQSGLGFGFSAEAAKADNDAINYAVNELKKDIVRKAGFKQESAYRMWKMLRC